MLGRNAPANIIHKIHSVANGKRAESKRSCRIERTHESGGGTTMNSSCPRLAGWLGGRWRLIGRAAGKGSRLCAPPLACPPARRHSYQGKDVAVAGAVLQAPLVMSRGPAHLATLAAAATAKTKGDAQLAAGAQGAAKEGG